MPVSGPSLITGCPCALSQAGCLGLLTVEKRTLWLECCGVKSGEHSSQSWVIAGSSARRGDKVASVCHMVAYYMLSHKLISQHWKLTKHPFTNMKSRWHKCPWVFALSNVIQVMQCHPVTATQCRVAEGKKGAFQDKFNKSAPELEK